MGDSNPTRVRYAENKAAFDEVIGDPFAKPEPIEGAYYRRKQRSSTHLSKIDDVGHGSRNPATPNDIDFFADVENIVAEVIHNKVLLDKFWRTYMFDEPLLGQVERSKLEQKIGRRFVTRRIVPVRRYFIAIRRPIGG